MASLGIPQGVATLHVLYPPGARYLLLFCVFPHAHHAGSVVCLLGCANICLLVCLLCCWEPPNAVPTPCSSTHVLRKELHDLQDLPTHQGSFCQEHIVGPRVPMGYSLFVSSKPS